MFIYMYNMPLQSEKDMKDTHDCNWRCHLFRDIGGNSPEGSGYITLQYWGNRINSPATHPYYFVIEMGSERVASFKIGPLEDALQFGRLAVQEAN